ncbi:paralemmin-1 isoform X1 [Gopherus flavomarginatus]|uniref:paralemmin-1 isoform X1 n=1 Tax=Gopherus flavomarginatus TaxID=286002 RepID=UPI0021CBB253|nr:paralemmin-1 isoform X1 [Gopherus flavomarginatus]
MWWRLWGDRVHPAICLSRIAEAGTIQQERLQAIAEKRKRQIEIENKRRQLEDDRRQLQHLKSKALRERWLLEGAPSSASKEDEAMKKQMQEDEVKSKELEEAIQRLERELEILENGDSAPSTKEKLGKEVTAKEEKAANAQKTPLGTAKEQKICNSPMKSVEGTDMMKAAMYSVEITVEKDRVTGETKVLSSTTLLPKNHCLQGVKVYEDEMKVVHAVHMEDGALENGVQPLSSSEVDELIHKADEVNLSEVSQRDSKTKEREEAKKEGPGSNLPSQKTTPRKEITGVQAKPVDSPRILASSEGAEPSKEQPVTMIFMGYQNVEDEDETKKVLGLGGTIKAELVVIEDADNKPAVAGAADCTGKDHAPPNGSTVEPVATLPQKEDGQVGEMPGTNITDPKGADQDLDMKKQRCKCCTVM